MLLIDGHPRSACDGISRRALLEAAGAGLFGMSLPRLLAAEARTTPTAPRAKAVIFVFLFGGPSQLETFDLKPDAPEKIRGPFRPIASRTPGLLIGEHLPRLAVISERFCVVRTMTHPYNDHSGAAHYLQTGKAWHVPIGGGFNPTPKDWPAIGSVVEYLAQHQPGGATRDLPAYAVVPNSLGRLQEAGQYLRPGEHAGWLGRRYNPLTTAVDKKDLNDNPYWRPCADAELAFPVEGLMPAAGLRLDRTQRRVSLLDEFDAQRRALDQVARVREFDQFRRRALALVASENTRKALEVRREPESVRDQYGRNLFGQSALVARRLVEAGARFVTVHYDACDGYGWDSHVHSDDVRQHLMPTFDQGLAALLSDLDARGLLAETLVVALGEMGRTPQATPRWGRGHWSLLFPAVLAGAGIRGGAIYGASDRDAAHVIDHPVSPESLAATIYYALGIPTDLRLSDSLGRPVPIVEGGQPVLDLFA
jgi:uncharacterized protein (DUF1501 family)